MSSGHKVSGLVFSGNLEMSGYKSDMNLKADYIEDKATVMWVGLNNDQMFEKLANSVEKSQEVHLILYDSGNDNSLPAIVKNGNALSVINKIEAVNSLTKCEKSIFKSLAEGLKYREIAEKHFLSINTVKCHVSSIYKKLDIHCQVKATEIYLNFKKYSEE